MQSEKVLIFLCSGAAKPEPKKLSYRIAMQLETMGVGNIGTLQNLSEQHSSGVEMQRNMIFINDCRSGCVNIFTHGFQKEKYVYFDLSAFAGSAEFDIPQFIHTELLPKLADKWNSPFS
jgi:uncharacterized metal-binding protein